MHWDCEGHPARWEQLLHVESHRLPQLCLFEVQFCMQLCFGGGQAAAHVL
jgi:hypothetical protein